MENLENTYCLYGNSFLVSMGRSEKSQPARLIWPVATESNATQHIPCLYIYMNMDKKECMPSA